MLKTLKIIFPYIAENKNKAIGAIVLAFILNGLKIYQATLIQPLIDKGLNPDSTLNETLYLAGAIFGVSLLIFPARFLHFYWIRYVVDRATCVVRSKIYDKFLKLPMKFFSDSKQGKLISNVINDSNTFANGFKSSVDLIREPVLGLGYLSYLLYLDWQLTLIVFVAFPLFLVIFQRSGKLVKKYQGMVQEEIAHVTHDIGEGISGQKIIKSYNLQDFVQNRFGKSQDKYFEAQMKTTFAEEFAHPLVELVGALAFCGVIVYSHIKIAGSDMTMGSFIAFIAVLALFMDPIRKFSQANVRLNQSVAAWDRIKGIFATEEEKEGTIEKIENFKEISVENLSFDYGYHKILDGVNLKIRRGEKVALVGLSGSGKSTLLTLLLGLYPIKEGDIKIDGRSIRDFKLTALRELFGLVSQDIFLFNDTVKENLSLGENLEKEKIAKALEVSYSTGFVSELPGGEDSLIGDRGMKLSGGQQQRLTIARAYVKDTPILLFDEATSALDNESEKVVQKALESLEENKTVVAVAHRLSTIQNYDRIYVMSDGKVVEQGKHEELLSESGEYAKLYALTQ